MDKSLNLYKIRRFKQIDQGHSSRPMQLLVKKIFSHISYLDVLMIYLKTLIHTVVFNRFENIAVQTYYAQTYSLRAIAELIINYFVKLLDNCIMESNHATSCNKKQIVNFLQNSSTKAVYQQVNTCETVLLKKTGNHFQGFLLVCKT